MQPTLQTLLATGADAAPAISAPARSPLCFAALRSLIADTLATLNCLGIARNDRVAIVLANGPEMATCFMACASGVASAPLNPAYRADEFEFYLSDLNAKALIVEQGSSSPAIAVAQKLGVRLIDLVVPAGAPAGLFTLQPRDAAPAGGAAGAGASNGGHAQPGDVSMVLHTSGTTSRPKIVPLSQANLAASAAHILRTLQFTATGVFTDGSNQQLTSAANWTSSDNTRVSVSNVTGSHGLASALSAGRVQMRASYGGVTGYTGFTVSPATLTSIAVEPVGPSVAMGLSAALQATGYFSDMSTQDLTTQVSWSSVNPGVATVSNAVASEGVVSTHALGTADISASILGRTGTTTVTVTDKKVVSIQLTEAANASAKPKGTTAHYTATGTYTDGSQGDITAEHVPDGISAEDHATGLASSLANLAAYVEE